MPRAEYEQYLRSQGASDEDVKALCEGSFAASAIRSFDASQAALASERSARAAAEQSVKDNQEWYDNSLLPAWQKLQSEGVANAAEASRYRTAILEAQKRGLVDVAKDLGFKPEELQQPSNPPANQPTGAGAPPASSTPANNGQYMTREEILGIARQEGKAIAIMAKMSAEHARLFPNAEPPDWPTLYDQAVAQKKPVAQFWEETYSVPAARKAADDKRKADAEAQVRADERKKVEMEFVSKYGNPDVRPMVPSRNVFAPSGSRPAGQDGQPRQPWQGSENALTISRVERAVKNEMERGVTH